MRIFSLLCTLLLLFLPGCGVAEEAAIQLQIMKPDSVQDDLKGPIKQITTVEYDLEGKKREISSKEFRSYDKKGNVLEDSSWDETGKLEERVLAEYNETGVLIGKKTMSESGKVLLVHSFEFSLEKKQIIETVKKADGSFESKTIFQYDTNGFEKEVPAYDANDAQVDNAVFFRDSNNKETEVVFYGPNKEKTSVTTVRWNLDGYQEQSTIEVLKKGEEFQSESTYKYEEIDKHGNWTKRTIKKKLKSKEIGTVKEEAVEEREIVYHE